MDFDNDRVQQAFKVKNELSSKFLINKKRQDAIQEAFQAAAQGEYKQLSDANIRMQRSSSRGSGFTNLLNIHLAFTKDKYPINPDHVYDLLRESGVVVPGLDSTNNEKNIRRLVDDSIYPDSEQKEAFKKTVDHIVKAVKPLLELAEFISKTDAEVSVKVTERLAAVQKWEAPKGVKNAK